MMAWVVVLLILNFSTLGALGYAVWLLAQKDEKIEPPEVFGEVWEDD